MYSFRHLDKIVDFHIMRNTSPTNIYIFDTYEQIKKKTKWLNKDEALKKYIQKSDLAEIKEYSNIYHTVKIDYRGYHIYFIEI